MPSFDIVSKPNKVEVKNALDQANKEISTRFDFKGSDARVTYEEKESTLTLYADNDFQLEQVKDVLLLKLAKRQVDIRFLDYQSIEKIGSDKRKQAAKLSEGLSTELGKKIVKCLKDSKIKVQGSIQGDTVRVTGTKRDDLQAAIALLKKDITDMPLEFDNFRD